MFNPVQLALAYSLEGESTTINTDELKGTDSVLSWFLKTSQTGFELTCHAEKAVTLEFCQILFKLPLNPKHITLHSNGFQSWTGSFPMPFNKRPAPMRRAANIFKMKAYGESFFWPQPNLPIEVDSNPWTSHGFLGLMVGDNQYIRLEQVSGEHYALFCPAGNDICLTIDIKGHAPSAGSNFVITKLELQQIETEAGRIPDCSTRSTDIELPMKAAGWTSWYHYYTKISEEIILSNLEAFRSAGIKMDYFQIDDGFQTRVGDWLSLKPDFVDRMNHITDAIHSAGYKAGLWLAPFVAEKKSNIVKKHRDWLKRDDRGKLVKCGWNPLWSGTFYALDITNPEVNEYLAETFQTVLSKWNFDLVKLDFLYAAALDPISGKSRGETMRHAMALLRKWTGQKKVLGCGVPIESSIGFVDYNRIGSDVALKWEDKLLKWLGYRERVSTVNSLHATLSRFQYDGKAFRNDPDVFILRDEKQKMTWTERVTLFTINHTLGSVLFTSDYIGDYSPTQLALYRSAFPAYELGGKSIITSDSLVRIFAKAGANRYQVITNLTAETTRVVLAAAGFTGPFLVKDPADGKLQLEGLSGELVLEAHQTKIVCQLNKVGQCATDGHLFPGLDIKSLNLIDGDIDLEASNNFKKAYVVLPEGSDGSVLFNDQSCRLISKDGYKYALFG